MATRKRGHRCRSNHAGSKDIPTWMDWEMKLLEEVPDEQGVAKEQHYYDTLKPWYNLQRPGQTIKERNKIHATGCKKRYEQSERGKEVRREINRKRYYAKKALIQ